MFSPCSVDYQYRKVDSDTSDEYFSYSGLWVAQSVLTVVGKRGANGRYECRVKTATESSPILTSSIEVTVNGEWLLHPSFTFTHSPFLRLARERIRDKMFLKRIVRPVHPVFFQRNRKRRDRLTAYMRVYTRMFPRISR